MSEFAPYDPADYLRTREAVSAFLEAAFEDAEADVLAEALKAVARAQGLNSLAESAGLQKEHLDQVLSPARSAELTDFVRVLGALGLRITQAEPDPLRAGPKSGMDDAA